MSMTLCRIVLWMCDTVFQDDRFYAYMVDVVIIEPRIRSTSAMSYLRYRSKTIQDVNNGGVVLFNHIANARL